MALKLWMGNGGSGKSHRLYEEIIRQSEEHKEINYLVIVPEQFTLQTQWNLVNMHPSKGILNIDVLNFTRLAYRVFEEVGFSQAPGLLIDDLGKSLILKKLATIHNDDLKVIGPNLRRLGYITEVKSVISEFMQYGVNDDAISLMKEQSSLNNRRLLNDKLDDIQLLYHAFRDYIGEKYTTSEELLERVSHVLPQSEKLKQSVVIFDGFTGFTPVQYKLMEALMVLCKDVHVTVLLDTISDAEVAYDEQELFFMSRKTIRELKHIAETNQVKLLPDEVIRDEIPYRYRIEPLPKMLIHLEKNLFREWEEPYTGNESAEDGNIFMFQARDALDEIRYTAVTMQKLIREKGYHYKDMAIVTGDLDTYTGVCERILTKYGIPHFVDKTQPILLNPFIEYIRSIMKILTENYSYEGIFGYLRSYLSGMERDDIDLLENYCIACGVRGKSQWNKKFIRIPKSIDKETINRIEELRTAVIQPFVHFEQAETVRDYCTALYHIFVEGDIDHKLHEMQLRFEKAGDGKRAKEFEQIYKEVIELLDKLVELLGDEKMPLDEFYELLDAGFSELRIGVIPNFTDYVQIGDLTRSRFKDIKALFFVGVNDGVVPRENSGGGIISDIDREFIAASGIPVELAPSARMSAYTQRLYLYMVMTKPTERLYMSCTRVSSDGKSMNPSYLMSKMREMYPNIQVAVYEDLSMMDRIYSEESGFAELAMGTQSYLLGNDVKFVSDYNRLYRYYAQKEEYRERLQNLVNSAFSVGVMQATDSVNRAIAHVIYGNTIEGGVTRLETFARCAYRHFLQYGLHLNEREEFAFETKDIGSVFHDSLSTYCNLLADRKLTWFDINEDDARKLIEEAVDENIKKYDAVYESMRSSRYVDRIKRIMNRTVQVLKYQLQAGDFIPTGFEVEFSQDPTLESVHYRLSEQDKMNLFGRIDRIDLNQDDQRIYVKIIDYKSGNKDFDLAAVYKGEQLQLVVYLNVATEMQKKMNPGKEILPAGILYYALKDPVVEAGEDTTDEELQEKILTELTMTGLVNSDESVIHKLDRDFTGKSKVIPVTQKKDGYSTTSTASADEFDIISQYVNHVVKNMGNRILDGEITPVIGGCEYCQYQSVCHKEYRRKPKYQEKQTDEEILALMEKTLEGGEA